MHEALKARCICLLLTNPVDCMHITIDAARPVLKLLLLLLLLLLCHSAHDLPAGLTSRMCMWHPVQHLGGSRAALTAAAAQRRPAHCRTPGGSSSNSSIVEQQCVEQLDGTALAETRAKAYMHQVQRGSFAAACYTRTHS
jgi:hypothetical protein